MRITAEQEEENTTAFVDARLRGLKIDLWMQTSCRS